MLLQDQNRRALTADISAPALQKSRDLIARLGLNSRVTFAVANGLDALDALQDERPDTVFILGMGGEVISGILDRADFVRSEENKGKIKFVLQPMTSEDKLRAYLCEKGFDILDEVMVEDKGRVYAVMSVCYDGVVREYTPAELLLGKKNIEKGGELFLRQLERRMRIVTWTIDERKTANLDCTEHENLLGEMKCLFQKYK